ncbi:MAG: glycosyltransferase, partial [Coriobacteriales bacterium]|nr:glycosyltransferase [Coriobacteriales bacterium]
MQNSCQISIIIPAFNAEEYIEQCLDSIINQTFKDIEIIVVDDGSTDSTEKIVRRYMATDTRIRIVKQPNMHAGIARNAGKRIAIGKYLLFLDADDFYELDMLEKMYLSAEEHQTDITICRSDYYNCIANEFM